MKTNDNVVECLVAKEMAGVFLCVYKLEGGRKAGAPVRRLNE